MTVLMYAAFSGSLDVVQWLVDVKKADISIASNVSNLSDFRYRGILNFRQIFRRLVILTFYHLL